MVGLILWTENGWLLFETSNCPQLFAVKTLNETKNYRSKDERVGWETDTDKIQSEWYRDNYTRLSCLCILFHCLFFAEKSLSMRSASWKALFVFRQERCGVRV